MDTLKDLLTATPMSIIALQAAALFYTIKNHRTVQKIKGNDLHELPEVAQGIRDMTATLQRVEVKLGEEFSYIRARLNGGGSKH